MSPEEETLSWIHRAVVGRGLCPFARAPLDAGRVRIVATDTEEPSMLVALLDEELDRLLESDAVETTLLVHPRCLREFLEFNDFLGTVDALIAERGLEGVVQVASFHPDFRFGDAPEDDPGHWSNRSPHPTLHLLRESSVAAVVDRHHDPDEIWRRNVETLRALPDEERRRLRDG